MKKFMLFFALLAMLFISVPANAQFNLGVKGGLNLSKLSVSDAGISTESKTGWFIGPMAEITLPIVGLGVDAAALYNQSLVGSDDAEATLKTIEIPVNLKWTVGLGSTLGFFIAAGPQFGFNVGDDTAVMHMKSSNVSANVGAGVKLLKHFQAGINYNFALTETLTWDDIKKYDAKNNRWQISAAYIF